MRLPPKFWLVSSKSRLNICSPVFPLQLRSRISGSSGSPGLNVQFAFGKVDLPHPLRIIIYGCRNDYASKALTAYDSNDTTFSRQSILVAPLKNKTVMCSLACCSSFKNPSCTHQCRFSASRHATPSIPAGQITACQHPSAVRAVRL